MSFYRQLMVIGLTLIILIKKILDNIFFRNPRLAKAQLCSKWYICEVASEYEEFCSLLKVGDIVQTRKNVFQGWAICVQDGDDHRVVHRYDPCRNVHEEKGMVEGNFYEEALNEFSKGYEIRINNARDKISDSKAVEEIVKSVREVLKGDCDDIFSTYHEDSNNSMHFVELARYPKKAVEDRLGSYTSSWYDAIVWALDGLGRLCGLKLCKAKKTMWYQMKDIETFCWVVRPGDLVEFNRGPYSHWAVWIFVEQRLVAHRSGCNVKEKWKGRITWEILDKVVKNCRFRINNSLDNDHKPKSIEEIFGFLNESLNSEAFGKYNLILNNCKRYAQQARYGIHLRKNLELITDWVSAKELAALLTEGDVIKFRNPKKFDLSIYGPNCQPQLTNWAIFVGDRLDKNGLQQVVYRCQPSGSTGGVPMVLTASLKDIFASLGDGGKYCIMNKWDNEFSPLEVKKIVMAMSMAVGNKDSCECDLFRATCPHFVLGARYGSKVRTVLLRRFSGKCTPQYLKVFQSQVLKEGDRIWVQGKFTGSRGVYQADGKVMKSCLQLSGSPESNDSVPLVDYVGDKIFRRYNIEHSFFRDWPEALYKALERVEEK